jgi:transposase
VDAKDTRSWRIANGMLNGAQLGDLLKVLWHDTQGMCLFVKRLEAGRFIWPSPAEGVVTISPAQLGYLLDTTERCPGC